MSYLKPAYFKFFDGLKANNNKEWFDANKATYEKDAKEPFRALIQYFIDQLAKDLPELNRDVKKCVFRINRDVRFSADKSPYKVNCAAVLSPGGTKDTCYAGYYIHFGADDIMIGGGMYFLDKAQIQKVRQEILYNHKDFRKVAFEKKFVAAFDGGLIGEKNKVLDKAYKEFMTTEPLIANKQWWFMRKLSRKEVTTDGFEKTALQHFRTAIPVNRWLMNAIQ